MNLRVTYQTMVSRAMLNVRRATDQLGVTQQQAATGKRLLAPSDDPLAAMTVLSVQAQDNRLATYLTNIQQARISLEVSEPALREVGTVLTQAQQVAIEGSHSGNTPEAREALAQQIDGILGRLLDLANTQHAGRYVFSGTADTTPPFVVTSTDSQGRPRAVAYQGSDERATVPVSQTLTVATGYSGREVFQTTRRGNTLFTGSTGAKAGTGTDSATGDGALVVTHTATTYAAGSGVQPGTGSVAGDTIIGPAGTHQLTVTDTSGTGAFGTVSLNGGPAVAFANTETNLKVTGPNGEAVFLDTTAITPGFSGNVDITADGSLSTDGGATSTPITFAANQVVTDGSGAVTNVDSTNIRRTGTERLQYLGTFDAFGILMAIRDDLRNTRGLGEQAQETSLSQRLAELDRVRSGILGIDGEQSVSLHQLDALETRVNDVQLELKKSRTELEGMDLAEAVLTLQSQQNLLQMTLASSARMFDQSLLDFIR